MLQQVMPKSLRARYTVIQPRDEDHCPRCPGQFRWARIYNKAEVIHCGTCGRDWLKGYTGIGTVLWVRHNKDEVAAIFEIAQAAKKAKMLLN